MYGNAMPYPALLIAWRNNGYLTKLTERLAKGMDAGRFVTVIIGLKNFHPFCPFPSSFLIIQAA